MVESILIPSTYTVILGDGSLVITTDDFDKAWDTLKKQPAGAKLIRDRDMTVLGYNSGYKVPKDLRGYY